MYLQSYKPSASLTCSASCFRSESTNSSMRFPQVASGLSSHSLNISRQQTCRPFGLCSASMCTTFRPSGSRSMRNPTSFQTGAIVSMMFTLSPLVVFSFISWAILGFISGTQNIFRNEISVSISQQFCYIVELLSIDIVPDAAITSVCFRTDRVHLCCGFHNTTPSVSAIPLTSSRHA